jgi:hypothetical protein
MFVVLARLGAREHRLHDRQEAYVNVPSLLCRLFGPPEEINGGHRCPTCLYCWALLPARRRLAREATVRGARRAP